MEERKSRYELFLEEEARAAQPTTKRVSTYKRKYKSDEDRFWKRYHACTVLVGDCLEWTASKGGRGVPIVQWKGKRTTVKRVVYQLTQGSICDDEVVISICNHPWCVRQGHMEKASVEIAEIRRRNKVSDLNIGRGIPCNIGEGNPEAKITEDDVREIRHLKNAQGWRQCDIARRFHVHPTTIRDVLNGRNWKHVQ